MIELLCWSPDNGENQADAKVYHAADAATAAADYVRYTDARSGEYSCVGGTREDIAVRHPNGVLTMVRVTGEIVRVYSAVLLDAGRPS